MGFFRNNKKNIILYFRSIIRFYQVLFLNYIQGEFISLSAEVLCKNEFCFTKFAKVTNTSRGKHSNIMKVI